MLKEPLGKIWCLELSRTDLIRCCHITEGRGSPTCKQSRTRLFFHGTASISPNETIRARTATKNKKYRPFSPFLSQCDVTLHTVGVKHGKSFLGGNYKSINHAAVCVYKLFKKNTMARINGIFCLFLAKKKITVMNVCPV